MNENITRFELNDIMKEFFLLWNERDKEKMKLADTSEKKVLVDYFNQSVVLNFLHDLNEMANEEYQYQKLDEDLLHDMVYIKLLKFAEEDYLEFYLLSPAKDFIRVFPKVEFSPLNVEFNVTELIDETRIEEYTPLFKLKTEYEDYLNSCTE